MTAPAIISGKTSFNDCQGQYDWATGNGDGTNPTSETSTDRYKTFFRYLASATANGYAWDPEDTALRMNVSLTANGGDLSGTFCKTDRPTEVNFNPTTYPKRLFYGHLYTSQGSSIPKWRRVAGGTGDEDGGIGIVMGSDLDTSDSIRFWATGGRDTLPTRFSPSDGFFAIDPNRDDECVDLSGEYDYGDDGNTSLGTLDTDDVKFFGIWVRGGDGGSAYHTTISEFGYYDEYVFKEGVSGDPGNMELLYQETLSEKHYGVKKGGDTQYVLRLCVEIGDGSSACYYKEENVSIEFDELVRDVNVKKYRTVFGPDNKLGLELNLASGNTVIFTNCPISSPTPWHFLFDSSAGATVTLTNCIINGAGGTDNTKCEIGSDVDINGGLITNCARMTVNAGEVQNLQWTNPSNTTCCLITTSSDVHDVAFSTETATDHAIEIATAGTYTFTNLTFDGFTKDLDITAVSGTVTINITGGDTPTYDTAGATVVINSGVTVQVTVTDVGGTPIENARVYLRKSGGGAEIINSLTNASGVVSTTFTDAQPQTVEGWIRKATTGTLYKEYPLGGSITTSGYVTTALMQEDQ